MAQVQSTKNGGYCLPCVIFAKGIGLNADPGILVNNPLTNFKKALEILERHCTKLYHKDALVKMDGFVSVMTGKQSSICAQLNDCAAKTIAMNE